MWMWAAEEEERKVVEEEGEEGKTLLFHFTCAEL